MFDPENVYYEPNTGCHLWAGRASKEGYGLVSLGRSLFAAHRKSYEHHKGEIPAGMLVMHKCDMRLCINPEHLILGTHADNMEDMKRKGRARSVGGKPGRKMPRSWSRQPQS